MGETDMMGACLEMFEHDTCEAFQPLPQTFWELTDEELTQVILAKLKVVSWLAGKIAGPAAEAAVKEFVERNREMIVKALKWGWLKLYSALKKVVAFVVSKIGK